MKSIYWFALLLFCSGCAGMYQYPEDAELQDQIQQRQKESQELVDSLVGQTKKEIIQTFGQPYKSFTEGNITVYIYREVLGTLSDSMGMDMGYGMAYATGMSREFAEYLTVYFKNGRVYNATDERR